MTISYSNWNKSQLNIIDETIVIRDKITGDTIANYDTRYERWGLKMEYFFEYISSCYNKDTIVFI